MINDYSRFILISTLGLGFLGALGGCAEFRDDWGDKTTQATAVGGAMGAGLGAIIGSQTGSAGAGLVLGGLAGAGAGAAIGTSLEERDRTLKSQDELIERQEQRLAANRRALQQLQANRDVANRDVLARNVAASPSFGSPSTNQNERVYRETTHIADSSRAAAAARAIESARVAESYRAAMRDQTGIDARHAESVRIAAKNKVVMHGDTVSEALAVNDRKIADRDHFSDLAEKEIKLEANEPSNDVLATLPSKHDIVAPAVSVQAPAAPLAQPATSATGGVTGAIVSGLSGLDDDCLVAEGEVKLASKASAAADKLFHQRKALRLCPNESRFHMELADTYHALNRKSDAEYELREALKLDPQNTIAQSKLKDL